MTDKIKIYQRKDIGDIRVFFFKTIKIIEPPKKITDNIPPSIRLIPCLMFRAVIINKIEKEGKIHHGRTPDERERNWLIMVSASMKPPIIINNSTNKLLKLLSLYIFNPQKFLLDYNVLDLANLHKVPA